ncbi:M15 family metallopeptidase [Sulfurospirillum arcachonense]|uniref:M15 family metallopeptidase n=1 Tax=Sulfurospirillum arcachonense TaxID=57666 RepID=UPI00046A265C|nr:M15 family metallopeptidase [Sulfurospirillum arcachonense]
MHRRAFLGLLAASSLSAMSNVKQEDNAVWLDQKQLSVFLSIQKKLELVKRAVGYGHFNILSFDDMLKTATRYSKIGQFTKEELAFIEEIFYADPSEHGFYGKRTMPTLTTNINKKEVMKIKHTGHYLFRGHSDESYNRVISDVGNSLILTSGVRGIPKQMNLYFNKIKRTQGNLTLASRSLAPPAYSYHSIGDFDIGKKGWGYKNFTVSFARTQEFWRLRQLSYISMRYTINNKDGVRFEPWHVKII